VGVEENEFDLINDGGLSAAARRRLDQPRISSPVSRLEARNHRRAASWGFACKRPRAKFASAAVVRIGSIRTAKAEGMCHRGQSFAALGIERYSAHRTSPRPLSDTQSVWRRTNEKIKPYACPMAISQHIWANLGSRGSLPDR
jgi:hypothetical protein